MKVAAEVCPKCEGTGWRPITTGADRRVTRCDCRLQERSRALLTAARIPKRYEHCELSEFDTHFHPSLGPALLAATKFVEEYPVEKTGLMFVGSLGVGKTHLAVGVAKALILNKGIACLFVDYRELLKQIQNSYNDSVQVTELQLLRPIFETEVLVLDELGVMKPTEWVWDTVSLILNTRYNDNRTTIITTNYPDREERKRPGNVDSRSAEAAKYSADEETLGDRIKDRMLSRLRQMCRIINLEGTDFRQKFHNANFR